MTRKTRRTGGTGIVCFFPLDKLLTGKGIRRCSVIDEYRVFLRCHVAVDGDFIAMSMNTHLTRGIDGAIESRFTEVGEIVSQ